MNSGLSQQESRVLLESLMQMSALEQEVSKGCPTNKTRQHLAFQTKIGAVRKKKSISDCGHVKRKSKHICAFQIKSSTRFSMFGSFVFILSI